MSDLDAVYAERNRLVIALAKHYPHGWGKDPAEPDWPVLYIDLPTGQVSWHFKKEDAINSGLLGGYDGEWDGHSDDEKYARLAALQ